MMLQYALRENLLTADVNDYMAQTVDVRSFNLEEIIAVMLQRGTTLTRADITAVLEVYHSVIHDLTADGNAVNTPLFNTNLSISGVFNGATDSFDAKHHVINVNTVAGELFKQALATIKTSKTESQDTDPYITEVLDIVSGAVNTTLSASGVVQLTGARLKFNQKDEAQGLFFVPETGNAVRCVTIAENKPARIMALIPQNLPNGNFYAEIRTKVTQSSKELKSLKVGRFTKPLTKTT